MEWVKKDEGWGWGEEQEGKNLRWKNKEGKGLEGEGARRAGEGGGERVGEGMDEGG